MKETPVLSMVYFLVASFLGALGQYLYQSGAAQTTKAWTSYVYNGRLLGGVICYILVMVLFIAAFKKGGALNVLYPIYATTFIFAALIAYFAYGAPIKPVHACGMVLLIAGMFLMGW